MTKANAIKILQGQVDYLEFFSKEWIQNSTKYTSQNLREISEMLGQIMKRDSEIIQKAIDELKPKNDPKGKKSLQHQGLDRLWSIKKV
jgi:hypothetical protein